MAHMDLSEVPEKKIRKSRKRAIPQVDPMDQSMNEYNDIFSGKENIKVFGKSGHYPHLEENEKFCEIINRFV